MPRAGSLRDPHGISTGKTSLFWPSDTVVQEQSLLSSQRYALNLNSSKASHTALVARFTAECALAVRRRRLPNKQPPCAPQHLTRSPSNRAEREAPVLSVTRHRVLDNFWRLLPTVASQVVALTCSRDQ